VTITGANDAPVTVADTVTISEDASAVVISVLDNDTDPENTTLTIAAKTDGANGTVKDNGDGTVSYTPIANFNGTDTFEYRATDGTDQSELTTVTVTVTAVNDDPTGSVTITGDAKTGQTLTASNDIADNDVVGDITYSWTGTKTGEENRTSTGETLTLTDDDIDYVYTVVASYTDGGNTTESVEATTPTNEVADIVKLVEIKNIVTTGSVELVEVDYDNDGVTDLVVRAYDDDGTVFTEADASIEINGVDYSSGSTKQVIKFDLYLDAEGIDSLDALASAIYGAEFKLVLDQTKLDNTSNFTSSEPTDWDDTDSKADNDTEYMEFTVVSNLFTINYPNETLGGITVGGTVPVADILDATDAIPSEIKIGTVYITPKVDLDDLRITIQEQLIDAGDVNVEPLTYSIDVL
jgi:hypothetical protein